MLILSRKAEQSIQMGNVRITVLGIQGGRVKIGIEAPSSVLILRGELDTVTDLSNADPEEEEYKRLELAVA
jgi:carbon storage regulator